jgi:hypothetical protein
MRHAAGSWPFWLAQARGAPASVVPAGAARAALAMESLQAGGPGVRRVTAGTDCNTIHHATTAPPDSRSVAFAHLPRR